MTLPIALVALAFAALGLAAERLASVWPADEASRRGPGLRTALLAAAAAAAGGGVAWRSNLPLWATAVHLGLLGLMVVLTATDLDQRRLPHLVLDPLILGAAVFTPFNPAVSPLDAVIGAGAAVAFLGLLGLLVRGGVATGDLYLVVPLGLLLGWPSVFVALFVAALLSAVTGLALLATRRAGMKSYIPFGPFLVAGTVITLLREPQLLAAAAGFPADVVAIVMRVVGASI
ncbi:MAG: A24 family peptidase [Chloroflexota bacterium]|nr:A24 family peptidase [Chloroflexota bacterium]